MSSQAQREALRRYNASDKGRASRRRYAATTHGRQRTLEAKRRYNAANAEVVRAAGRRRYRQRVEMVNAIKLDRGCADCGYKANPVALDFDHAGSNKTANVSSLLKSTWENVLAEIEKCDVVCANCHRIRTFNERQRWAKRSCL